jgi:predicted PolB exonuclease-like 3'-5' exonuclease
MAEGCSMKPFYFDIETIPAQDPAIRDELRVAVTAPGTFKKPESIAEWLTENREKEAEAAWLKTSFDGGVGHVFCIAYAIGDNAPRVLAQPVLSRDNEAATLEVFFRDLEQAGHVQLIGHNIVGFDIPFLWKRAMVLGVKPPFNFPRNPKPWSELIADTMLLWDATQRSGGSMDRICRLMGITGKGDFGGADVWPAIERGEFDRVAEYCGADVERTRAMYKRMTFA